MSNGLFGILCLPAVLAMFACYMIILLSYFLFTPNPLFLFNMKYQGVELLVYIVGLLCGHTMVFVASLVLCTFFDHLSDIYVLVEFLEKRYY